MAVHDLCRDYLIYAAGYYRDANGKATTEVRNIHYALKAYNALYGEEPIDNIGPVQIRNFQSELIKQDKARTLINKICGIIRRMVKWAVSQETLDATILVALQAVPALKRGRSNARETFKVVAVPRISIDQAIQFLPPTICAMINLQTLTAMRPQEVCGMRLIDIDMSDSEVWVYEPPMHKTSYRGTRRTIYLGPRCQKIIKPFLNRQPTENLFTPSEAKRQMNEKRRGDIETPRTNKGYDHRYHPLYSTGSYRTAIRRACIKASINIWSPNQLRHHAKDALEKEFGVEVAAAVMGHNDVTTTKLYGEKQLHRAREAAKNRA